MTTYTVKAASKKKDVPAREGKAAKQVIALTLAEDGKDPVIAEWFTNASTPLPAAESTIEGDLANDPQWGWKFTKAGGGGWNNGPRPEDPQRAKRILRQHSQDMALRYAEIRHQQGKLPDTFSLDDLWKLADKFDADAEAAAA